MGHGLPERERKEREYAERAGIAAHRSRYMAEQQDWVLAEEQGHTWESYLELRKARNLPPPLLTEYPETPALEERINPLR
jgi:hypothetical protein